MSRRHLLVAAAVVVVLAAACGDAAPPAASTTTTLRPSTTTIAATTTGAPTPETTTTIAEPAGPGSGGAVVIGDDQVPPTLNPYAPGGDNFIVAIIGQALHTGVWDVDAATLERIPEVVVELPTVGNGGISVNGDGTMTVRYVIRDEAQWADGTPISGDDFAFTYETLAATLATDAQGGRFEPYDLIDTASIEAGPKTFAFTMTQPSLAHEELFRWLIPRHQVEGTDALADWDTVPWVSGGPFVFDTWERGDAALGPAGHISLVRNEHYWKTDEAGTPLPYLDEVTFAFHPETEQLLRAFAARELDVIQPPPWPPEIERVLGPAAEQGAVVTIQNGPVWEHFNFQFGALNRNADSLNRYVEFRRAVAHALDLTTITDDLLSGYGTALSSYVDAYSPELSARAWDRYAYDPEEARRLLADVCAELGRDCDADPPQVIFSTTQNADARPRIADHVVEMLGAVGIDVELQMEDSQLYFGETLSRGDWDMGLWAWVGSPGWQHLVEAHDLFDPAAPPPEGSNYYRWGTPAASGTAETFRGGPEVDVTQGPSTVIDEHTERYSDLVAAMHRTVDETELARLVAEAESTLADQVVIIPLYARLVASAYWADEVAGYEMNPSLAGHTWNIERWYRVDR